MQDVVQQHDVLRPREQDAQHLVLPVDEAVPRVEHGARVVRQLLGFDPAEQLGDDCVLQVCVRAVPQVVRELEQVAGGGAGAVQGGSGCGRGRVVEGVVLGGDRQSEEGGVVLVVVDPLREELLGAGCLREDGGDVVLLEPVEEVVQPPGVVELPPPAVVADQVDQTVHEVVQQLEGSGQLRILAHGAPVAG